MCRALCLRSLTAKLLFQKQKHKNFMLSELIKCQRQSTVAMRNEQIQSHKDRFSLLRHQEHEHLSKHHRMSSQAPNALKINVVTHMEMKRCRNKLKSDQMADKWAFYESQF